MDMAPPLALLVRIPEVIPMAIEAPKKDDLKRIAKENYFEMSDA